MGAESWDYEAAKTKLLANINNSIQKAREEELQRQRVAARGGHVRGVHLLRDGERDPLSLSPRW